LKGAKGGDIKVVNSKHRWTQARGWHLSTKFQRFVRVIGILGMTVAPLAYTMESDDDVELRNIVDEVVALRTSEDAGDLDFIDKKIALTNINLQMKNYFDRVMGGTPATDLVFLFQLYDIMGTTEFKRVEGEDP
jgi:hypothetical protein